MSSSRRDDAVTISAFAATFLVAAWLRLDRLGEPSLWLDEILHLKILRWLKPMPLWKWLIGIERENGPLYYAVYRTSLHLSRSEEWALRFPSVVAGLAAIVVIALLARRAAGDTAVAIVAGVLLAISPFHVHYSREGRPYALLVLFSLTAALALVGREERPRPLLLFIAAVLAAATGATAAPLLAALGVVTLSDAAFNRLARRDSLLAFAGVLTAAAYGAVLYGRFEHPPEPGSFVGDLAATGAVIVNGYSVTGREILQLTPLAALAVILAIVGFLRLRSRRSALVLAAVAFLPPLVTVAALALRNHWLSLRYAIHGVGPFLVLVAAGIVEIAGLVAAAAPRWLSSVRAIALAAIAAPLVVTGVRASTTEPYERTDWRGMAKVLSRYTTPADIVIASGSWPGISLYFYMNEIGHHLEFRDGKESLARVSEFAANGGAKWLVVGGFTDDDRIRSWACGSFVFARDEIENVRIYYLPGVASFVRERGTPADRARYVATTNASREGRFSAADRELFLDGWYGPERNDSEAFRWSRRESSMLLPVPAGATDFQFTVNPMLDPSRAQRVDVSVDGRVYPTINLSNGFATYAVPLGSGSSPRVARVDFRFAWEASPAEINGAGDTRLLAAAFTSFAVDGAMPQGRANAPMIFNVTPPVKRDFPRTDACSVTLPWTAASRSAMLARAGLTPGSAYDIASTGSLATLVVDALPPRDCLSDGAFLDAIYPLLLNRSPDRAGRTYYGAALTGGWSREQVVCSIAREKEFRDAWGLR